MKGFPTVFKSLNHDQHIRFYKFWWQWYFLKNQLYIYQIHLLYTVGKPFKSYFDKIFQLFYQSLFSLEKIKKTLFKNFKNILIIGIFYFEQFLNQINIFHISKKFYSQFEYADHENGLIFIPRVHFRNPS